MLMSSSKLFLFSKEVHFISGVRLLLELYCAVVIKHVAFFTILAKLTVVFTCTSLPLNLYTSIFGCGCGFGFEQKFWRIDGFGEKKARIGGFPYPYSPPYLTIVDTTSLFSKRKSNKFTQSHTTLKHSNPVRLPHPGSGAFDLSVGPF